MEMSVSEKNACQFISSLMKKIGGNLYSHKVIDSRIIKPCNFSEEDLHALQARFDMLAKNAGFTETLVSTSRFSIFFEAR